jgi:hypothetical protein
MKQTVLTTFLLTCALVGFSENQFHFKKVDQGFRISDGETEVIQFMRTKSEPSSASEDFVILLPNSKIENAAALTLDRTDAHQVIVDFDHFFLDNLPLPMASNAFVKEISKVQFYKTETEDQAVFTYITLWKTSPTDRPFFQVRTEVSIHKEEKNMRRIDLSLTIRALRYNLDLLSDEKNDVAGMMLQLNNETNTLPYFQYDAQLFQSNLLALNAQEKGKNNFIFYAWNNNSLNNTWNFNPEKWALNSYQNSNNKLPISVKGDQTLKYSIFVSQKKINNKQAKTLISRIEKQKD